MSKIAPLAFICATATTAVWMVPAFQWLSDVGVSPLVTAWLILMFVLAYAWTIGDRIAFGRWWWERDTEGGKP